MNSQYSISARPRNLLSRARVGCVLMENITKMMSTLDWFSKQTHYRSSVNGLERQDANPIFCNHEAQPYTPAPAYMASSSQRRNVL
ncbi:hypothetical protein ACVIU7_008195 [Bradyrhizobium liaoningense]